MRDKVRLHVGMALAVAHKIWYADDLVFVRNAPALLILFCAVGWPYWDLGVRVNITEAPSNMHITAMRRVLFESIDALFAMVCTRVRMRMQGKKVPRALGPLSKKCFGLEPKWLRRALYDIECLDLYDFECRNLYDYEYRRLAAIRVRMSQSYVYGCRII